MKQSNIDTINITPDTNSVKIAAIYCRVSTENQEIDGTSLDTQRAACLKYCQEHGYAVTHQFRETYSGLSIERPELDNLRSLIRNQEIDILVVYSLDRLTRDPNHGVILRQERERYDVSLEAITETVDSSKLGQLIEYIYGYAANLEAEKIRERTQRGIRARVFDKHKPVSYRRAPYGYDWDRENNRLVPNADFDNAKLILNSAIDGKSYDWIIAELKRRSISSPSGLPKWNKHTISTIIRNPVYFGQYYAFKSVAVKPKNGNGKSRKVKSSVQRFTPDQWIYIPEIEIVNPLITQAQHTLLMDQLKQRQNLSSRNAKRDYLLRGMLLCGEHIGKNGEPRAYHGQPHHDKWRYTCPVGGCESAHISGPEIEYEVKFRVFVSLYVKDDEFFKMLTSGKMGTSHDIEKELEKLEKEKERNINNLATLEDRRINNDIDIDVYNNLHQKYIMKRKQTELRIDDKLNQLSQIEKVQQAIDSRKSIKQKFLEYIGAKFLRYSGSNNPDNHVDFDPDILTQAQWRELLTLLNYERIIMPERSKVCENDPAIGLGYFYTGYGKRRKKIYYIDQILLPLELTDEINIALGFPGNALHNQLYYPIRFSLSDFNIDDLVNTPGGRR